MGARRKPRKCIYCEKEYPITSFLSVLQNHQKYCKMNPQRRPTNYCDTCKRGFRDPYSLLRHMMQSKLHKANQLDAFSALLDVVSDDTPAVHADAAKPKAKLVPRDDVPSMPTTPFTPSTPLSSAPTPKMPDSDRFNTDRLSESCAWSEGSCSARGTELAWKDGADALEEGGHSQHVSDMENSDDELEEDQWASCVDGVLPHDVAAAPLIASAS